MKILTIAAALVLAASTAFAADLEISGAFMRASPKVANAGAGFLTIKNNGAQNDRLIAAEAGISKIVELHTHEKDGDIMRMRRLEFIAVPAGETADLKPGGDHVMFIGLHKPLAEGETVPVTLVFEKAGRKVIDMPVLSVGAMKPMGH
jgi:copper(I)-binding protein